MTYLIIVLVNCLLIPLALVAVVYLAAMVRKAWKDEEYERDEP